MKAQIEYDPEAPAVLNKAQELQHYAQDTAKRLTRATTEYIEDNPWKAIAIVAVCALALGFVLRAGSD